MSEKRVTSRANPRVRFYRGLEQREAREESGCFPAEGVRLVVEALRSGLPVPELFLADGLDAGALDDIREALARRDQAATTVHRLSDAVFGALAHTRHPQGAAAVVRRGPEPTLDRLLGGRLLVLLYRPADPGNLGTILRSSEAAGFDGVVLIEPACDPWNPKVVRASMGSVFRVPVARVVSLPYLLERLDAAAFQVLAAVPGSPNSFYALKFRQPLAVLFGGETAGLPSPEGSTTERPTLTLFSLPMRGRVDSLNLAQAATVVLYEVLRRDLTGRR